ncbi:unnamed protein product [Rotaria sp. Silwood1]|nr:unnamed protein product [Rotaria sp. Silwood1]CAF0962094.1 unnamed protein product [Rotaria sp. Silwood1]CAF3367787.1 unnamed protein product [Rotaria sp. Silwood1]CAF3398639.1 unnamed protein product [Rotaria sp. Silwood1]CAF3401814.1 unnamed protein product [Rotaria sp. Silwood1]
MDVFMMIRRQKLTLFIDAKESSTVLELKKMIEGITKVPANNIRLIVDSTKQPMDDDNQTLADCGLSGTVAKAYSPTLLYLCYRKTGNEHEWEPIDVAELSTPPPLPDVFNKPDDDKKDNTQIAS